MKQEKISFSEIERFIDLVRKFQQVKVVLGRPITSQDAFEKALRAIYGNGAYLAVISEEDVPS